MLPLVPRSDITTRNWPGSAASSSGATPLPPASVSPAASAAMLLIPGGLRVGLHDHRARPGLVAAAQHDRPVAAALQHDRVTERPAERASGGRDDLRYLRRGLLIGHGPDLPFRGRDQGRPRYP